MDGRGVCKIKVELVVMNSIVIIINIVFVLIFLCLM